MSLHTVHASVCCAHCSLVSTDHWLDWCVAQFGQTAGPAAAAVFESIDSFLTPRPVNWGNGPGSYFADGTQCAKVAG
jgi:hypothetical protein